MMYLIIGGCGRIGSNLAELFSIEGEEVVVIDKNENAFERLGKKFVGSTVSGNFSEESVLEDAGAEKADVVLAVTSDDNVNIVGCQIAKEIFDVAKTVARINEPKHEASYGNFDIDSLITPSKEVASLFKNAVFKKNINSKLILGDNDVELLEIKIDEANGDISEIKLPNGFKLCAIQRSGRVFLVNGDEEIEPGDNLFILAESEDLNRNHDWFEKWK